MRFVVPGVAIGPSNPVLQIVTSSAGFLVDAVDIRWSVTQAEDGDEVVPETALDLVGNRLGVGRYAIDWAVPGTLAPGGLVLSVVAETASETRSWTVPFEAALPAPAFGTYYVGLAQLRDEGLDSTIPDGRALARIRAQSSLVERLCRRFFEPRYMTLSLDGAAARALRGMPPIIAIESVTEVGSDAVSPTDLVIYNRHLAGMDHDPDDRIDPRIEWVNYFRPSPERLPRRSRLFVEGRQNYIVAGIFGYTEADGSFVGRTPEALQMAVGMMVSRQSQGFADFEAVSDATARGRVNEERTRDQSVSYDPRRAGGATGYLTGEEPIDALLEQFVAGAGIGAV